MISSHIEAVRAAMKAVAHEGAPTAAYHAAIIDMRPAMQGATRPPLASNSNFEKARKPASKGQGSQGETKTLFGRGEGATVRPSPHHPGPLQARSALQERAA